MPMFDTRIHFEDAPSLRAHVPAANWGAAFDALEQRAGRPAIGGTARPLKGFTPVIVRNASVLHRAVPIDQETVFDVYGLEG